MNNNKYDKLLTAIETIYDCVGDDYDRDRALKTYSQIADDSAVVIADMDLILGHSTRLNWYRMDKRATETFSKRLDCPAREKMMVEMNTHPVCVPIMRQSVLDGEVWLNSPLYKIGSEPWGFHSEGHTFITGAMMTKTFSFFFRHPDQEPIDAETFSMMSIVNNHLRRALTLQNRIDRFEEALIRSNHVLDLIEFGLALYDVNQNPVFVNAAAQRIFDDDDGLRLRSNEIEIRNRDAHEKLQGLIEAIYRPGQFISQCSGGIVTVPRASGSRPYSLMVVPMRSQKLGIDSITAAVFIFDPNVRKTTAIEMFVGSYGLTQAEAEIAHTLALGYSLDETAEMRGISRNTAKTQLHSIFDKTETHRQPELVSLLLRSVVGINLET